MTTEPKDVLGGDEAKANAPSPSDPPPVREAVAWRVTTSDNLGSFFAVRGDLLSEWIENGWTVQPLYADPLPVSREAVARIVREHIECAMRKLPRDTEEADGNYARLSNEAADEIILALTGETGRG